MEMRKKIVLLGPYPPPYGGVSIYISTLFEFLKNRGVQLWTFGDEEVSGPNVHFMRDKRRQLVPLLLREGRGARIADSTHFLVDYPSLLVPLWVGLKALLRFEWLKIMHDGSLPSRYEGFGLFRRALFRLAIRSVTEFIAVSEELEHWLKDEIGVRQNVTVIRSLLPNSHRAAQGSLPAPLVSALRPYFQQRKRVCSIGFFTPAYGFKHVADAIETVRQETGVDIGLALLDGHFLTDMAYKSDVLRDRDWVTVLTNVPHPVVFQILKRSDVFVRTFGLESYGLSRIEAIWCGLPVVATRAGETRGMLLYDFGDLDGLVTQLKRALFDKPVEEINAWAARYQQEANANLSAITLKLGVID